MTYTIPEVEKRLQDRYEKLVAEHSGHAHPTASGPRVLPGSSESSSHAAAMAAWRFFLNPRTTFTRLAQPLLDAARDSAATRCSDFALVPVDWSRLDYKAHPSKTDRAQIGNSQQIGYKLLSALLVSDTDGQPLAPLCAQLHTAEGLLSSRFDRPRAIRSALDELAAVMAFVSGLDLGKRAVFVIDAEADSVDHYRKWDERGFLFLVRADGERHVRLLGETEDGEDMLLSAIAARLGQQGGAFRQTREVDYRGEKVWQYVAEAAVVLDRPAYQDRRVEGQRRRRTIKGKALPLRLVVTELRGASGEVLERWYLLSNVPAAQVDAATIALWYYWRWKIESFFKLLKGAGQQVERWQQENGRFILKRLLIASMACVLAWRLAHSEAPQGEEARRTVMRLSGRQVEHGKSYTLEGLLAGLWVLLAMADLLEEMPASRLRDLARFVLGGSCEPPATPPPRPQTG
jgi:Transposase DDE domain